MINLITGPAFRRRFGLKLLAGHSGWRFLPTIIITWPEATGYRLHDVVTASRTVNDEERLGCLIYDYLWRLRHISLFSSFLYARFIIDYYFSSVHAGARSPRPFERRFIGAQFPIFSFDIAISAFPASPSDCSVLMLRMPPTIIFFHFFASRFYVPGSLLVPRVLATRWILEFAFISAVAVLFPCHDCVASPPTAAHASSLLFLDDMTTFALFEFPLGFDDAI